MRPAFQRLFTIGLPEVCPCGKTAEWIEGRMDREKWTELSPRCGECADAILNKWLMGNGYMTAEQAAMIQPGDALKIRPSWGGGKLEVVKDGDDRTTIIRSVRPAQCQTGTEVNVVLKHGGDIWLDAAWFEPKTDMIPF